MKLTKKLEAEILKVYHAVWDAYLKGDMRTFASILDENCHIIGSAAGEVFSNKKSAIKYYKATAEQVTGKAEFRNRKISLMAVDDDVMVNEQSDFYVLIDDQWTFYGDGRISSLFHKKNNKWKVIHQHGSFPDSKTEEGEQVNTDKIKAENLQLRDAVKRRTLELEEKNRELEIEAALEKIRSRSLAMHKSDELWEVVAVVFEKLQELNFSIDGAAFIITFIEGSRDSNVWLADDHGQLYPSSLRLPYYDTPSIKDIWLAKESGLDFFSKTYSFEEKNHWLNYAFKYTDLKILSDELKNWILEQPCLTQSFALGKNSMIGIHFHHQKSLSETEVDILKRFSKVFDQAYIRFFDLQKAEAQARESQIQLALERVRARTMAMQRSDELQDAVSLMVQQIQTLGVPQFGSGFNIWDDDRKAATAWMCNVTTDNLPPPFKTSSSEDIFLLIHNAAQRGETLFVKEQAGKELETHYKYMNSIPVFREYVESVSSEGLSIPDFQIMHCAFFSHGYLMFITYKPVPEAYDIFKRFAKVFEQTYTRFLDLQKAEAQAREAQIQLALERVRARTMAMQHSDELKEAAALLFQQVKALGVPAYSCGYNIWEINEQTFTSWMSSQDGSDFNAVLNIPLTEDANFIRFAESREKGEQFFVLELRGERMQEHYDYLKTIPAFKAYFDYAISVGFDLPETQIHHLANFSQGNLLFITLEPCPGFHDVFKRFAAVFEQTYTRFLDLQKAETQAREAQIQLAMERVRARTMAMQKSDELPEAANLLFLQVQSLGMPAWSAGYCIWDDDKNAITLSMSSEGVLQPSLRMPLTEDPSLMHFREAHLGGETFFVEEVGGETLKSHYEYLRTLPGVKETLDDIEKAGFPVPAFQIFHCAYFSEGFLLFITYEPVPEAHDIFKRFARVFEQTYTRFLDLQKAEAQVRKAKIEAALERTRTQSMLMQHSKELDDTLRVFHEQVLLLGINSAFSFLWLPDEKNDRHIFWAAWGEDKNGSTVFKSKAINYPLDRNEPATALCLVDWKSNEPLVSYHVPPAGVESYFAAWQELIDGVDQLKPEYFSGGLYYVEAFMKYGCFGVMVTNDLTGDEKKILGRLAIEFERTYTRFLDLQKAEAQAREAQIQLALERVRARTMAMQKSDELGDVATVLFKEMNQLVDNLWTCGFVLCEKDRAEDEWWLSTETGFIPAFYLPNVGDVTHANIYNGWINGETYHTEQLEGEALKEHYDWLMNIEVSRKIFEDMKAAGFSLPTWQKLHCAYFSKGYLCIITQVPCPEEEIFKRFAQVFDLTYTRFLDLQKAEAQAKEAQIEAALERVRSRSMGMQKSEELKEVIQVVFEQFIHLNINIEHTGFVIDYKARDDYDIWIADPLGVPSQVTIPYFDSVYYNSFNEAKEKGIDFFATNLSFEEKNRFYQKLFEYIPGLPEEAKEFYFSCPGLAASTVLLENIGLYIENFSGIPYSDEENATLMRFGKVFQQTYTRFLDLQKAEAQARESQIETALERVRSRSMGMQKSEELREVGNEIYKQLVQLNFNIEGDGFILDYPETDDLYQWGSDRWGAAPDLIHYPYINHPYFNQYKEAKDKGLDFLVINNTFEEKNALFDHFFQYLPGYRPEIKEIIYASPGLVTAHVFLKNVVLYVWNMSGALFSETENATLMRFGKVFEQAYIRFNDLKQAEAQAREAKIEAALEKVRSRTMAMQRSAELAEVATVLFQQVKALGVPQWTCGFSIFEIDDKEFTWYPGGPGGEILPPCKIPLTEHPVFISFNESRKRGDELYIYEKTGEEQADHYRYMCSLPVIGEYMQSRLDAGEVIPAFQIDHLANFSHGNLIFITYEHFPEMHDVFKRFAKVFDQTYTRFLDLQKSEAQARESKIEAALERVRSHTMAMHKSENLLDIISVISEQLLQLGFKFDHVSFGINNQDNDIDFWMAVKGQPAPLHIQVPYLDNPIANRFIEAQKEGREFFADMSTPEENSNWVHHLFQNTAVPFPEETKLFLLDSPGYARSTVIMKNIFFMIGNYAAIPYTQEENMLCRRFANVFDQAYTRFLDLQTAETQAREAKIEASMEKVRARAMAMQKPGELVEVAQLLRSEMGLLGVEELEGSTIFIHSENSDKAECWFAIKDIKQTEKRMVADYILLGLNDTWVGREMLQFFNSGEKQISIPMQGQHRQEWIEYCYKNSTEFAGFYGETIPDRIYHLYKFSNGAIGAAAPADISRESWDLLKRATTVFSLAYTRFSDLQIAETSAKEALKQAALDRVRAEIASMRTISDLDRITPLIWNELTILGVPFIRCGVFIMDDSQQFIHTFLSTPDGKAIAAFHLPYDTPGNIAQVLSHWHDKRNYIAHWDESAFTEFADILARQGALASSEQYLKTIPHGGFYLHFLPFLQGMLYVGNTTQLNEDEIKLIQSVADAFSTAYARYEDFNRLEAAKQQVDKTLVDLKQAQQQLVQSEKMASLGELTAGIAHEIQNPLNFVNNFSDVSNELLEEMRAELEKGNKEDAMAIVDDVKQNLEKILHHGKRADAIVKGMLQHSRTSSGQKELTDINVLADEYLRLSYHGLRAKDKSFNAKFETDFDQTIDKINVMPQDIGRVILNLINNAFYAVSEKKKQSGEGYEPTVSVSTKKMGDNIELKVSDNGTGIPQKVLDKIFQPFFTTKPTGQGTGLGLSLAYDIVKAHGGEIKVETKENEGTGFKIVLPA